MSTPDLPPPLKEACQSGDLAQFSKEFNALPTSQQIQTREPLSILAIEHNQLPIFKYCLSVGVLPTSLDVIFAAFKNRSPHIFSALLAAGLPPTYSLGRADTVVIGAIIEDNFPVVSLLFSTGATLKDTGLYQNYYFPLAATAMRSSTDIAALLLAQGAPIKHSLALQMAAKVDRVDMLKFFLDQGADINENPTKIEGLYLAEKDFGTALHYSTDDRRTAAMRFLLDRGADATLKDNQGRTVVERSKGEDGKVWKELVDKLKERGVEHL